VRGNGIKKRKKRRRKVLGSAQSLNALIANTAKKTKSTTSTLERIQETTNQLQAQEINRKQSTLLQLKDQTQRSRIKSKGKNKRRTNLIVKMAKSRNQIRRVNEEIQVRSQQMRLIYWFSERAASRRKVKKKIKDAVQPNHSHRSKSPRTNQRKKNQSNQRSKKLKRKP